MFSLSLPLSHIHCVDHGASVWANIKPLQQLFPPFFSFLQHACYGSAHHSYPNILIFIDLVAPQVLRYLCAHLNLNYSSSAVLCRRSSSSSDSCRSRANIFSITVDWSSFFTSVLGSHAAVVVCSRRLHSIFLEEWIIETVHISRAIPGTRHHVTQSTDTGVAVHIVSNSMRLARFVFPISETHFFIPEILSVQ